ncbi:hypothetical protein MNBD_GAMMA12-245 [hydrothermal vent metagenome]|uniref:DUF58 domain-containing protein n=1 Tax=hydrothermal vent metagenome TaxID=652676 RepID=A0A3B0YCF4_9ZZZZ
MFNPMRLSLFSNLINRHKPKALFDANEILALAALLQLDHQHDTSMLTRHLYAGSQESSHRGEGMDFLENRQYLLGDNPRHINWRLSARLGNLHTRVFQEDKQSQTLIILDRRPSMWFGTQQQLKVRQAVSSAILFMFAATKRHNAFACLQLDTIFHGSDFHSGSDFALLQAEQLARVDNRMELDADSVSLAEALSYALDVYPRGNEVIIISDFFDMDQKASAMLGALNENNRVISIYITDPADTMLPRAGSIDTVSSQSGEIVAIDTGDPLFREHYQQTGEQKKHSVLQVLRNTLCLELGTEEEAWQRLKAILA